jgi:hypothetical protein
VNAPGTGTQLNIPSKLLRPIPRKRSERFAWRWADTAWVAASCATCAVFAPHDHFDERALVGVSLAALCATSLYVTGLKMHGRVAGVAAAALLVSSRNFIGVCMDHPTTGALACAVIVAVACYSIGWTIAVYLAACLAFTLGFNGALIGAVVSIVPVLQRRSNAHFGLIAYFAFGALWSVAVHRFHIPTAIRPWSSWRDAQAMLGLAAFVAWFMAPFCAEATLKGARERWLLALAVVAVVTLIVFTSTDALVPQLYLAYPMAMLVVAVGLARLMPAIAGEYPTTGHRYAAAAAAVVLTVGLKVCLDPTIPAQRPIANPLPDIAIHGAPAMHLRGGSVVVPTKQ